MSDQGFGGPPPPPEGGQGGGWQPVNSVPPPGYQPPPGQPPFGQQPPGHQQQYGPPTSQPMAPTSAATVAYLTFIGAVVMLVLEPYKRSDYVRFHAWQCLMLTGALIVGNIVFRTIGFMGMHGLTIALHSCFDLTVVIFWLISIIKANQGERYRVPILGDLAENLTRSVQV